MYKLQRKLIKMRCFGDLKKKKTKNKKNVLFRREAGAGWLDTLFVPVPG